MHMITALGKLDSAGEFKHDVIINNQNKESPTHVEHRYTTRRNYLGARKFVQPRGNDLPEEREDRRGSDDEHHAHGLCTLGTNHNI